MTTESTGNHAIDVLETRRTALNMQIAQAQRRLDQALDAVEEIRAVTHRLSEQALEIAQAIDRLGDQT